MRLEQFLPQVTEYVKANIFTALGDSVSMIRNTVSTVIDTLLVELGPQAWPEALSKLVELIDSNDVYLQEVSSLAGSTFSTRALMLSVLVTGSVQHIRQALSRHSKEARTHGSRRCPPSRLHDPQILVAYRFSSRQDQDSRIVVHDSVHLARQQRFDSPLGTVHDLIVQACL